MQDIFSLFHLDRSFKFISKTSNFYIPIVGWSMFLTGESAPCLLIVMLRSFSSTAMLHATPLLCATACSAAARLASVQLKLCMMLVCKAVSVSCKPASHCRNVAHERKCTSRPLCSEAASVQQQQPSAVPGQLPQGMNGTKEHRMRRPCDAEPHGPAQPAAVPGRLPRAAAAGRLGALLPGGHAFQGRPHGRLQEGAPQHLRLHALTQTISESALARALCTCVSVHKMQ